MVSWNSASGGFAYIWPSMWIGIIAIKTERTQIHFLSDVLVAVASLGLKVPNDRVRQTYQKMFYLASFFLPISYRSWISCLCRLLSPAITTPCGTSKAIFLKCTAQLINKGSANILIWVAIFSMLKRWRIKLIEIWDSNLLLTDMHEKHISNLYGICGDNSQRKIIAFAVC